MVLRFFADHCVPNSVQKALTDDGREVLQLKDHLPVDAASFSSWKPIKSAFEADDAEVAPIGRRVR